MKMTELRAENESLKQQIQLLSQQKEGEQDTAAITRLQEKNRSLKKSVKDLKAERVALSGKIQALENDKSSREQEHQILKADFARIQQQLSELSDAHARTITEVEGLRNDQKALLEKASQLPIILAEVDRLRQVENLCNEKSAQAIALQAELEKNNQLVEEVRAKASQAAAEYEDQKVKLSVEMDMMRKSLLAELDDHREQSSVQITSLLEQRDKLAGKVIELTEKLKIVATHLEKQLSEKRKITYQYDTNIKEYQAYKDTTEKQKNDLMALLQKMAVELDAVRAHPNQAAQSGTTNGDKPAILGIVPTENTQPQRRLRELQEQVSELDELNGSQARELADLSARMERVNHALASPFGRVFSQLLGLKNK